MTDTIDDNENTSLRETIQFYLIDSKTIPGKLIDIFIVFLNVLVCAIVVLDTYPISDATRVLLWRIELVTVFFFIIEYVLRLYGARNRTRFVFNMYSIIDILAIIPTILFLGIPAIPSGIQFIRIIRVFRIFRIFRFLRFTTDTHFFFGEITFLVLRVVRLVMTILLILFVSSGLFWVAENPSNESISTFGEAFYFTVVTVTTVGFGDIIPVTELGRWITLLMILSGIILIPWQASQILREWVRFSNKKHVVCPQCGLRYHDEDASHCKACGHVIYQEYDG